MKAGNIYVEFLESNREAAYTPIDLALVQIREDDHKHPILTTNLSDIGNNHVQSAETSRIISVAIYLHVKTTHSRRSFKSFSIALPAAIIFASSDPVVTFLTIAIMSASTRSCNPRTVSSTAEAS